MTTQHIAERMVLALRDLAPSIALADGLCRRGVVTRVADDVAWVAGLDEVGYEALVAFDGGGLGMALDLSPDTTGVVLLSGRVGVGVGAVGLPRLPALPVGPDALGRVVDPLGIPLDGGPPLPGPARPCSGPHWSSSNARTSMSRS
ncbi:MAG: hypothetical protein R2708_06995 [Vicinamibacterales bacterium]